LSIIESFKGEIEHVSGICPYVFQQLFFNHVYGGCCPHTPKRQIEVELFAFFLLFDVFELSDVMSVLLASVVEKSIKSGFRFIVEWIYELVILGVIKPCEKLFVHYILLKKLSCTLGLI
jgi:hypothetical protein